MPRIQIQHSVWISSLLAMILLLYFVTKLPFKYKNILQISLKHITKFFVFRNIQKIRGTPSMIFQNVPFKKLNTDS